MSFIEETTNTNPASFKLKDLLKSVNTVSNNQIKKETWDISSTSSETCDVSTSDTPPPSSPIVYHPKKCWPTNKAWINDYELNNGIRKILNDLNIAYDDFLKSEIKTIDIFKKTIQSITNITLEVSGADEGIFSFINCKFINSNMQIILVNLKNVFGGDLYMIGIYLLMAAFSLAFAISFTILLTVILKTKFPEEPKNDKNNQNAQKTEGNDVIEYPMNTSEGRFQSKRK